MFRKLYDWVFSLARSRHATPALAVISFAESSFFPVPPDVMLAPMILARPEKAYCYAIGYYLTDLGLWLMNVLGHSDGLAEFQHWFDRWGLAVILVKGLTPIPYKLVTIASGLAAFSFPVFVAASVVTRGARFFAEAWVLRRWGPAMLAQVEKRLAMWSIIGIVVLVGAVVAVKLL